MKIYILCLLVFTCVSRADLPIAARPTAVVSPNGRFVYVKIAAGGVAGVTRARGVLYELDSSGAFVERWSDNTVFGSYMFIADDGVSMVVVINPVFGRAPAELDVGLAFYRQGQLTKAYSTKELLTGRGAASSTMSFYRWMSDSKNDFPYMENSIFYIKTLDGYSYVFNYLSGDKISKK